jgi:hypothetical protein
MQLRVNPAAPDFTGSVTPNWQLVTAGQTASYVIQIIPLNGFTGKVIMSATGLPSDATGSPTNNPIAGGSGSTTLADHGRGLVGPNVRDDSFAFAGEYAPYN